MARRPERHDIRYRTLPKTDQSLLFPRLVTGITEATFERMSTAIDSRSGISSFSISGNTCSAIRCTISTPFPGSGTLQPIQYPHQQLTVLGAEEMTAGGLDANGPSAQSIDLIEVLAPGRHHQVTE